MAVEERLDELYINSIYSLRYNIMADIIDEGTGLPAYNDESVCMGYDKGFELTDESLNNYRSHIKYLNYFGDNPISIGGGAMPMDGLMGGGFSGLVTNPKMKMVLSDVDHINSGTLGQNFQIKYNDYHGCCTSGPTTWYGRAGFRMNWWRSTSPATYAATVQGLGCGFIPVAHGTRKWLNSLTTAQLRPGDVATLYTGTSGHQHGVMWTGKDWRSDCIQKGADCYPRYPETYGDMGAVLWRHPQCQEPGLAVTPMSA